MEINKEAINIFVDTIKNNSSYDFTDYSQKSLSRRLEKILYDNKMNIEQLSKELSEKNDFLEQIVKDVTVNTTEIFRDAKTWQLLKYKYLDKFKEKSKLDIWHIGCSTGQEVYSMLILLNEKGLLPKTNINATDLNTDVLSVAEKGIYRFREIDEFVENCDLVMSSNPFDDETHQDVSYEKYININRRKNLIKVKPIILNKVNFSKHNLITDGNVFDKKFDVIFCRNVLIYFNHELQNRLFDFFYDNLKDDGMLVIGRHEGMLGLISNKFSKEESIYLKK